MKSKYLLLLCLVLLLPCLSLAQTQQEQLTNEMIETCEIKAFDGMYNIAPNNILWGIDVWIEDFVFEYIKRTNRDKTIYLANNILERENEIFICLENNDTACALESMYVLEKHIELYDTSKTSLYDIEIQVFSEIIGMQLDIIKDILDESIFTSRIESQSEIVKIINKNNNLLRNI